MRVLQEGTRLADRYTLVRRLGVGGMSEVWLADDRRSDSQVALKLLAGEAAADETARKQLHREWSVSSRMMHANIVRVFEYHDDADGPFFGLQFLGENDISVVAGKETEVVLRPIGLVADALRYAHAKGVIHRDIKASNILLDNRGAPYITDFGVADSSGGTRGGGSEIASSPQQLAGEGAQPGDDIFSLGVLMHELLTGVPPLRADSAQVNVTLLDGSLMPPELQALLNDMLASDASKRPDAETVATRLQEVGFAAGAVPARYLGVAASGDEVIESVETFRPARRATAAEPSAQRDSPEGMPPRILYGALGAVVALLLLVVFVLPSIVTDDPRPAAGQVTQDAGSEEEAGENSDAVIEAIDPADVAALKTDTDEALGDLLSQMERLRYRAVERWGGQPYLDAVDVYRLGDEAYVDKNYRLAGERYREASAMLEPFFGRIDDVFAEALEQAQAAFDRPDPSEAVRLYDLAVAITPGNAEAEAGLARALNLESLLTLTAQGVRFENDLELDAARTAFEKALEIDDSWLPAREGLERVLVALKQLSFEQLMTEGFDALADGDFASARASFSAARELDPTSRQPGDGLLQVDQEIRLRDIRNLEQQAASLDDAEQWETSIPVYEDILEIDPDLQFAKEGLYYARQRSALHANLQKLIDQPDELADPANITSATNLLLDVTKISPRGPRLEEQKNELSRLLKRAATPLQVQLVSDNATDVTVFRIGRLGTFSNHELSLRPGLYVAVGNRPGFRDVRIEFRVAPEIEMKPVVVQCEEQI